MDRPYRHHPAPTGRERVDGVGGALGVSNGRRADSADSGRHGHGALDLVRLAREPRAYGLGLPGGRGNGRAGNPRVCRGAPRLSGHQLKVIRVWRRAPASAPPAIGMERFPVLAEWSEGHRVFLPLVVDEEVQVDRQPYEMA